MKVYIGPYVNWIGPYQIADKVFFWLEKYPEDEEIESRWDYKAREAFGEWLSETWVTKVCQWIHNKKNQKQKIKIDPYDTWSADYTLALIITPMLRQLRDTKHGAPLVDDEDVPVHFRSTAAPPKKNEWDTDDNHFIRWDYVLDEMIWAFEQHTNQDAESQFHTGKIDVLWEKEPESGLSKMVRGPNDTHQFDKNGWEKWNARKQNGFRLFGKYYTALWD